MVWGVSEGDGDGKFVELAGGDETLAGGKESGLFDGDGGKGIGVLDDREKDMAPFDSDGGGEETGVFNDGGAEEAGVLDKEGGKERGIFDDKGEVGGSDDGGGEEAGAFDEGGAEAVGVFDETGGKELGLFDERS